MDSEIQRPVKTVEGPTMTLKTDPPAIAVDAKMSGMKDGSISDATSCISSVDATSIAKESEVDQESVVTEQSMYYPANGLYGHYYPGVDGSFGEWDAQNYFVGTDGLEIQSSANQVDNGSVLYYIPGFQPDYSSYNALVPGTMMNVDGQYFGQQLYYPTPMFSEPFISPGLYPQSVAYGPDLVPAYSWDPSTLYADGLYGNFYGDSMYSAPKPNFSSQTHIHVPSKSLPMSKSATTDKKLSSPNLATQNQTLKPLNKLPSYVNQGKSGLYYPHTATNIKETGRTWIGTEKPKARTRVHESGDFDMLNEQNRGPRTSGTNSSNSVVDPIGLIGSAVNDNKGEYNLPDFPTKYDHALFFVIKSYSEDDIHKSIKYKVWASTPNGNKRLDNAFQVAQDKLVEKGNKCPVFLFFSVNASGQFCGVAEMIGRVDFSKNMEFWQQDKWTGYFPVKWHIIKDVPNPQLRHIILENNENKPVTNSRDTQEVKFMQGSEMLNIFKNYYSKTSILEDFTFYENRQKAMQDRRINYSAREFENILPKTDGVAHAEKPTDIDGIVSGLESIELAAADAKEQPPAGGEVEK